jgi:hypothetical protein
MLISAIEDTDLGIANLAYLRTTIKKPGAGPGHRVL